MSTGLLSNIDNRPVDIFQQCESVIAHLRFVPDELVSHETHVRFTEVLDQADVAITPVRPPAARCKSRLVASCAVSLFVDPRKCK